MKKSIEKEIKENFYNPNSSEPILEVPSWVWIIIAMVSSIFILLIIVIIWLVIRNNTKPKYGFKFY